MKEKILAASSSLLFIVFIVIVVKIIMFIITYFTYIIFILLGLLVVRYTIIYYKKHRNRIYRYNPPKEKLKKTDKEYMKVMNEFDELFNNWENNKNLQTKNKI